MSRLARESSALRIWVTIIYKSPVRGHRSQSNFTVSHELFAPYFVSRGYIFFVPHRRGQGRSPGAYIMDQLNAAISPEQRSRMLVSLNEVHLQDQLAALT